MRQFSFLIPLLFGLFSCQSDAGLPFGAEQLPLQTFNVKTDTAQTLTTLAEMSRVVASF